MSVTESQLLCSEAFRLETFLFPQHDSQGFGSVRVFQIQSTENSMTSEHFPVCPGTVLEAQLVKLAVAQLRWRHQEPWLRGQWH